MKSFNTQPPEGGWDSSALAASWRLPFQHTAARRRLVRGFANGNDKPWFQHTAARRRLVSQLGQIGPAWQFQHTAARRRLDAPPSRRAALGSFNTQPPEGGWLLHRRSRRQLPVSTHSRPKAAGKTTLPISLFRRRFNTQPPEGGWEYILSDLLAF